MPDVREWPSQLRGNGQSLHESETVGQSETGSRRVVKCEPTERIEKGERRKSKKKKDKVTIFPRVRQSLFLCAASAPMEFGEPVIPCYFVQLLEPQAQYCVSALSRHAPTPKSKPQPLASSPSSRELSVPREPSRTDCGRLREATNQPRRALNVYTYVGRQSEPRSEFLKIFGYTLGHEEGADTLVVTRRNTIAVAREWGTGNEIARFRLYGSVCAGVEPRSR